MEKHIYMSDLHFEHKTWKSDLKFAKDELKSFESRLAEVANDWTDKDVLARVEHFQNTFIRQHEVIDTLVHDIKIAEHSLVEVAKDHPIANDKIYFKDHTQMRDRIDTQINIYRDIKKDFMNFLIKTM